MGLLHQCQRNDGASDLVARPIASFAHDGTERRIPQNPAEQTDCYSGKKKDHTVKNILLVNAPLIILFLSDTAGGRIHDKRLAEPYPLPAGSRLLQDLGFLAFTLPQVEILMPTRKPPGAELSPAPACCMEEAEAREPPSPAVDQATRTESGRSSIRLRTWAAMATSVARAWSLWKRSPSPMTCFQRANWPSIPAR